MLPVEVRIPAAYVSTGWGTPTVCARHGESAVAHKRAQFVSGVAPRAYLLVLLGVVGLIVLAVIAGTTRKRATSAAWPFCRRCIGRRAKMLYLGAGLIVGGVALGVTSAAMSDDVISTGLLWGILVLIVGAIVSAKSSWAAVAGGRVVDDGQTVQFRRAQDAFAAQAVTAQQAAAQHYAAQHAAHAVGPVPNGHQYAAPEVAASAAPQQASTSLPPTHPSPAAADFPQPTPTATPHVPYTPPTDPPGTDQP